MSRQERRKVQRGETIAAGKLWISFKRLSLFAFWLIFALTRVKLSHKLGPQKVGEQFAEKNWPN